jgi:hypothetical protein
MIAASDCGDLGADLADTFEVTFFPDMYAKTMSRECLSVPQLVARISSKEGLSKDGLPWLKGAIFGEKRTKKNCLRHNANVLYCTAAFVDYDGGVMSFAAAVAALRAAAVRACVYTSASHEETAPRWRVICPFSDRLDADQHAHMIDRLNGVLGGVLANESWTLSQAYYYGRVSGRPFHIEPVEGRPIDLCGELDAGAIGKPKGGAKAKTKPNGHDPGETDDPGEAIALEDLSGWAQPSGSQAG